MVARLPLRAKLTLLSAGALALVLLGVGIFVYLRVKSDVDRAINGALRDRARAVAAVVARTPLPAGRVAALPDPFAQLLDASRRVRAATSGRERASLLSADELERARTHSLFVPRSERARLFAMPLEVRGQRLVIVTGTSLKEREKTLESLAGVLLVGGPLLLLLLSGASFALATGALRPVEAMRRRAAAISAERPGERLPVPDTRDELHRLGETLNTMLARLESALEHERRFVADASHELRTPVAILKVELELALERDDLDTDVRATLASAAEEAERLAHLADNLLLIARGERGEFPMRLEQVAAQALLERVAGRFRAHAAAESRALTVDPSPLRLEGDPPRLEQALANLVDNAFRYGKGPIRLRALDRNGSIELHVLSDGSGFPPDFLSRAFDRFSRGDSASDRHGAGLGLAIALTIARAHGGDATAENRHDGGADVWLTLPNRQTT